MYRRRALFWMSTLLSVGLVYGQANIVSPQGAVVEEKADLTVATDPQTKQPRPTDLLQLIYECSRATGAIIDEGRGEFFRIYGFQFIDGELYQLQGLRALTSAVPRAELKAKGGALEMLKGLQIVMEQMMLTQESTSSSASSSGSPNGNDRQRINSVSASTQEVFKNLTQARAEGYLKGGRVSGTKFVSLGNNNGYCVIVRYDIPLSNQNQVPQGGSTSGSGTSGGNSSSSNPGQRDPIPPGSVGDF